MRKSDMMALKRVLVLENFTIIFPRIEILSLIVSPTDDWDKIWHKGGDFAFYQRIISHNDVLFFWAGIEILLNHCNNFKLLKSTKMICAPKNGAENALFRFFCFCECLSTKRSQRHLAGRVIWLVEINETDLVHNRWRWECFIWRIVHMFCEFLSSKTLLTASCG